MKKLFSITLLTLACAATLCSCSDKFKTTDSGFQYKFINCNKDAQQLEMGDLVYGVITFKFDTTVLNSNAENPGMLLFVEEKMLCNLQEGLLMMHVGDSAVFAYPADSLAKQMPEGQMPPDYKADSKQMFFFEVRIDSVKSKKTFEAEETKAIKKYITENAIEQKPTESGLYVIVKKQGTGAAIEAGKKVAIDYTGRLLDGKIFDTSREQDAKAANIFMEGRPYEPLKYTIGEMQLIKGWDEGVMGQTAGTELTLVIPSKLAYGTYGNQMIPPYSPLAFDITIVSVE